MRHPISPVFLHFSFFQQTIAVRKLVAVVTALAFALLLSAALSHHHETALDTQDCVICAVAMHKGCLNKPLAKLQQPAFVFLYQAPPRAHVHAYFNKSTCILPPSCGPPSSSSFT